MQVLTDVFVWMPCRRLSPVPTQRERMISKGPCRLPTYLGGWCVVWTLFVRVSVCFDAVQCVYMMLLLV